MNAKFKSFQKFDENSFAEVQNVSFKATGATNSFINFDCRSPAGSLLLADPVLETVVNIKMHIPANNQRGVTYLGEGDF